MKSQEIFKGKIHKGEISLPKDTVELVSMLDRYLDISEINDHPHELVEQFKISFIQAQKYKKMKCGGAYISAIKQALGTAANNNLNKIILAWYETDLITYAIQQLIIDEKIKLKGKKVYLTEAEAKNN